MLDRAGKWAFSRFLILGRGTRTMRQLSLGMAGLLLAGLGWCPTVVAEVCQVPSGTHPTIQAAVDDGDCTEIVLAAQLFVESVLIPRGVTIRGSSQSTSTIAGQVTVQGGTTQVTLEDLTVDATVQGVGGTVDTALQAAGGAELITNSVVVRNSAVDLWTVFMDGFESGDTSAWSATVS